MKQKQKIVQRVIVAVLIIIACVGLFFGVRAVIFSLAINNAVPVIEQVDEDGYLYYAEYTADYGGSVLEGFNRYVNAKWTAGCSAFVASDEDGNIITGRNYDMYHKDPDGEFTGLNVVLKCDPEDGYASIGTADAAWVKYLGMPYYNGAFDLESTDLKWMAFLPYLCMDGMNEKGLVVSIFALDIKEGESPIEQKEAGKESIVLTRLIRIILDNCATVNEAVAAADSYNIHNMAGSDHHLLVSDADGNSVVLEWRNNELTVTETDAVTNFYLSSDDACDCYKNGVLKEAYEGPADTKKEYHYGYGHGYHRFNDIVTCLDEHGDGEGLAVLSRQEAKELLAQVAQTDLDTTLNQVTQYSVIYNNTERSMEIWPERDYDQSYNFEIAGR